MKHAAIPTMLRGITYRSRLEARWAELFRLIGWRALYEPFDGDGYIPDFLIDGDRPFFVEVKPAITEAEYLEPVKKVAKGLASFSHEWLIVGAHPLPRFEDRILEDPIGIAYDNEMAEVAQAHWTGCALCGRISWHHSMGSYACRPCGHYEGDHYLEGLGPRVIEGLWNEAGEQVRWNRATPTESVPDPIAESYKAYWGMA